MEFRVDRPEVAFRRVILNNVNRNLYKEYARVLTRIWRDLFDNWVWFHEPKYVERVESLVCHTSPSKNMVVHFRLPCLGKSRSWAGVVGSMTPVNTKGSHLFHFWVNISWVSSWRLYLGSSTIAPLSPLQVGWERGDREAGSRPSSKGRDINITDSMDLSVLWRSVKEKNVTGHSDPPWWRPVHPPGGWSSAAAGKSW